MALPPRLSKFSYMGAGSLVPDTLIYEVTYRFGFHAHKFSEKEGRNAFVMNSDVTWLATLIAFRAPWEILPTLEALKRRQRASRVTQRSPASPRWTGASPRSTTSTTLESSSATRFTLQLPEGELHGSEFLLQTPPAAY